jgi:hypothetical protein
VFIAKQYEKVSCINRSRYICREWNGSIHGKVTTYIKSVASEGVKQLKELLLKEIEE